MAEKYSPEQRRKRFLRGAVYLAIVSWTLYPTIADAYGKARQAYDRRTEAAQNPNPGQPPAPQKVQVCRDLMTLEFGSDHTFTVVFDPSVDDYSLPDPDRRVQWYDTRNNALISLPTACPPETLTGLSENGYPTTDYQAPPQCRNSKYLSWRAQGGYNVAVSDLSQQMAEEAMTLHMAASAALRQECAA